MIWCADVDVAVNKIGDAIWQRDTRSGLLLCKMHCAARIYRPVVTHMFDPRFSTAAAAAAAAALSHTRTHANTHTHTNSHKQREGIKCATFIRCWR